LSELNRVPVVRDTDGLLLNEEQGDCSRFRDNDRTCGGRLRPDGK